MGPSAHDPPHPVKNDASGRPPRGRHLPRDLTLAGFVALAGALVAVARATLVDAPRTALAAPRRIEPALASEPAAAPSPSRAEPVERALAPPSTQLGGAVPLATRAVRAAGELALELDAALEGGSGVEAWCTRARVLARSLGAGARETLSQRVREVRADEELLALAELLRHPPLARTDARLAPAALEALRRAARAREQAPERFAAASAALAFHGDADDRVELARALVRGSPRVRAAAATGLRASREGDVVPALVEAARGADATVALLALDTLEELATRLTGLDALAPTLSALALDPSRAGGVRARASTALAALDPERARDELRAWVADAALPDDVARSAALVLARGTSEDVRCLEELVAQGRLPSDRTALVATLLAQQSDGALPPPVVAALVRAAAEASGPNARRAAVLALRGLDRVGADALATLARVALGDPDARVRDEAARALEALDRTGRYSRP